MAGRVPRSITLIALCMGLLSQSHAMVEFARVPLCPANFVAIPRM